MFFECEKNGFKLETSGTFFRANFFMFVLLISNHTVFLVQFGISLHEWVFQKAEIARAASASYGAISAYDYLLIIKTWKNLLGKKCQMFLAWNHFFRIPKTFFQSFRTKFLSLLYMMSLTYKISHCLSANHNPELRYVICTGVTHFALELHCSQPITIEYFLCVLLDI